MSFLLAAMAILGQPSPRPLELVDGDRICLVGDTLIERDQVHGYLETEILLALPSTKLVFRNIGWSGDTPTGSARAYFDPPPAGLVRLLDQIRDCKPTIVVFGYGMADALAGTPADQFSMSLNRLIERLPDSVRAMVLISPVRRAKRMPNSEGIDAVDDRLVAYQSEIVGLAQRLGAWHVDLQKAPFAPEDYEPNGIHLSESGYREFARRVIKALALPEIPETLMEIKVVPGGMEVNGKFDARPNEEEYKVDLIPKTLPSVIRKKSSLRIEGLRDGSWKFPARIVDLAGSPWSKASQEVRDLVRRKNDLYFERYRPQNITYLQGFRQHEQGQNAREIEQLDPLIEKAEKEIDARRQPFSEPIIVKSN